VTNLVEFMSVHVPVMLELQRLLGFQVVPGSPWNHTPVGRATAQPLALLNAQQPRQAMASLMRTAALVEDLRRIEAHDGSLFRVLRRRLRDSRFDTYVGARCEAKVASRLIRTGTAFVHEPTNGPDFVITGSPGAAGLECTTTHIAGGRASREADVSYKLAAAIRRKGKKAYARPNVALIIENTPLEAFSNEETEQIETGDVPAVLASTPFGSVVVLTSILREDRDMPSFTTGHNRFDALRIDPAFARVLDRLYPVVDDGLVISRFTIPDSP
jgi:hypothetical protein